MRRRKKNEPLILKNYKKYPFLNLALTDMKGEKWKDLHEFEGYIKVSNYGRVWSLARPVQSKTGQFYYTKERIMKQKL
ncbi:MAG: NUMOD4 domain-containing protein, partial [Bacteroidota bacterium]